jgi:gas vesicle protein
MPFFHRSTPVKKTLNPNSTADESTSEMKHEEPSVIENITEPVKNIGKKGGSSMMLGTTAGILVGATVGGIAGAVLSDEESRRTFGKRLTQLAKGASETAKRLSENSDTLSANTRDTLHRFSESMKPLTEKNDEK